MVLVSSGNEYDSQSSMVTTNNDEDVHDKQEIAELKAALTDALQGMEGGNDSYVERSIKEFHTHSKLQCKMTPQVTLEDLTVGETIGKGGFAQVKAVEWLGQPLAMKQLRDNIKTSDDAKKLEIAAADLIKEAEFLSALTPHEHIVGIRAKHIDMTQPGESFLVLERLDQTLMKRMGEWRERDAKLLKRNPKQRERFLHERLHVCLDIAKTLQYMHEKNVLYRDLKAENLGFDADGNVKLFDFGLAKELKEDNKSATGKYRLSGNTGSLAYMAPEVAKGWKYDKTVDVYSFGVLMWEVSALQHAFPGHSTPASMANVWAGEERPHIEEWWPVELAWLFKKCWSYFPQSRPDFGVIVETLEELLDDGDTEAAEEQIRSVRSFRFGSRRSQMLARDSSTQGRRITLRPRDLPEDTRKKKLFGIF